MRQNFYRLRRDGAKCYSYAESSPDNSEKTVKCRLCKRVCTEYKNDIKSVCFIGERVADYYFATGTRWSIISEKFQNLLLNSDITGYELKEIESYGWYDTEKNPIDIDGSGYKQLIVTGRCGDLRFKSGRFIKKCKLCNNFDYDDAQTEIGLGFDLKDWGGHDMSLYNNWGGNIIVTQKVKDLIEKNKLRNVDFELLSEFDFDQLRNPHKKKYFYKPWREHADYSSFNKDWTKVWEDYFDKGAGLTQEQILKQLDKMSKYFGIEEHRRVKPKKNKKPLSFLKILIDRLHFRGPAGF
ncbi:MAG: hypothetical protein LBH37_00455 [Oscillospiraceae bacterium]|nr:hypothetical protein [Oscillospiraceae bacterium]